MLIVQPTSTCNVCLDCFALDVPASESRSTPHVIKCGHVFCRRCLENLRTPRTCPLCRASFHLSEAVNVRVDLASASNDTGQHPTAEEAETRALESHIAEISLSGSSSRPLGQQQALIVEEALAFLNNAPPESHPILHALLVSISIKQTLSSLQSVQAENSRLRSERDHARSNLYRAEHAREQEQARYEKWMRLVAKVERDNEVKLREAAVERQRLQDELADYKQSTKTREREREREMTVRRKEHYCAREGKEKDRGVGEMYVRLKPTAARLLYSVLEKTKAGLVM